MMSRKTLILISLLFSTTTFAQWGPPGGGGGHGRQEERTPPNRQQNRELNLETAPKGNSKITGNIVDSELTTAVEFASVALLDGTTGKALDGTMADENGKFEFKKIGEGTYTITISFVGYETLKIEKVKVEKGKDVDLGVIKLKSSSITLEGVVVTGEKPLIEEKVDRLVYNAEKDLTSAGGDASDVLKNVPMLSVDLDGNVSLRGSENIQVLINNKPSTIVASSIADALKMIPSELIKSVEVITSPSAKYDAEGTAGIINIITKKSTLQGLNLNINGGLGNRASNLGFNGNYRTGKLGISFGGFGRMNYNKSKSESFNENLVTGLRTDQLATGKNNGMFGRYNLGFDYDLGSGQTLYGGMAVGVRNFNRKNDQRFNYSGLDSLGNAYELIRQELRDMEALTKGLTFDYNLDYVKVFSPGTEWSVSAMYSHSKDKSDNYTNYLNGINNTITQKQWNDNDNLNTELTFQTDFMKSIGKNQQLEVGAKSVTREIDSKYLYLLGSTGVSQDRENFDNLPADPKNPGGGLKYSQTVYAAYAAYTYSTASKWTIKAGGRFEYTTLDADQTINQVGADVPVKQYFSDKYPVFVPSVNLSKPFGTYTTKLSYNYRIQRPGMRQLNPNINIVDPLNVSMGTTDLNPEKTHNVELSVSKSIGKSYLTLSTFGRYSGNNITRISMTAIDASTRYPYIPELQNLDPSAIVTTFENVGKESTVGGNIFANIVITRNWNITGNFDMYYVNIEGKEFKGDRMVSRTTDGVVLGGRLSTNLKLSDKWSLQANGGYRGKRVNLQGAFGAMPNYSLAIRYDINKDASLGLGADNFFGGMTMKNNSATTQFISNSTSYMYNQNVRLTFSYKLGNMKFVQSKKRGINNDDTKGGDEE
jgi:outer membrane receptor protein involved in Fe transport